MTENVILSAGGGDKWRRAVHSVRRCTAVQQLNGTRHVRRRWRQAVQVYRQRRPPPSPGGGAEKQKMVSVTGRRKENEAPPAHRN